MMKAIHMPQSFSDYTVEVLIIIPVIIVIGATAFKLKRCVCKKYDMYKNINFTRREGKEG